MGQKLGEVKSYRVVVPHEFCDNAHLIIKGEQSAT